MKLSIVATLFNSELYIIDFLNRIESVSSAVVGTGNFEIILVNDGSPDDSLHVALQEVDRRSYLTVIDLSRNFGHHKAIMTGLSHSVGDNVFLIDSDLEEQPEWLEEFHRNMLEKQCDVVFGVQNTRKGKRFEQWSGQLFYSLINYLANAELPKNPTVARLMSKNYVQALVSHQERELYIGGLMYLTGFTQLGIMVQKLGHSQTTYSPRHKLSMLVNSVTSLSYKPLTLIFYLGVTILLFSTLIIIGLLIQNIFFDRLLVGWSSLTASIWITCGLIMSSIGVLGLYLSKIFSEVKQRPYTIIKKITRSKGHEN